MNIPNLLERDEFKVSYSAYLVLSQLFTELQKNLSDKGYVIPRLTTDEINALDVSNGQSILVVDSDTTELKISLGGVFKVVQVV